MTIRLIPGADAPRHSTLSWRVRYPMVLCLAATAALCSVANADPPLTSAPPSTAPYDSTSKPRPAFLRDCQQHDTAGDDRAAAAGANGSLQLAGQSRVNSTHSG
jgi:hypothetical protein